MSFWYKKLEAGGHADKKIPHFNFFFCGGDILI